MLCMYTCGCIDVLRFCDTQSQSQQSPQWLDPQCIVREYIYIYMYMKGERQRVGETERQQEKKTRRSRKVLVSHGCFPPRRGEALQTYAEPQILDSQSSHASAPDLSLTSSCKGSVKGSDSHGPMTKSDHLAMILPHRRAFELDCLHQCENQSVCRVWLVRRLHHPCNTFPNKNNSVPETLFKRKLLKRHHLKRQASAA